MSKLIHVIIVPGFSEAKGHFKGLVKLLRQDNFQVVVIQPWQIKKLEEYRDRAVFIGHSIGAYSIATHQLVPSLLIGLPDKLLVKTNFKRFVSGVRAESRQSRRLGKYYSNRLLNGLSLLKNAAPTYKLARQFDTDSSQPITQHEKIIMLQNEDDIIIKPVKHATQHTGHHEDVLYNPEAYIPYVKRLAKYL